MKKAYILFFLTLLACSALGRNYQKAIQQVDFSQVLIHDRFWTPRLENNVRNTLPVCIDQIENKTGRIRNFEKAAIPAGPHSGIFFDDSDVYKAVEGMAYSLVNNPDAELEKKADAWIEKFAAAQQPDGYINTFYTINGLDRRWTDMDKHEMYCAGHLIEAGIAYQKATGKRTLLNIGQKMADYMMTVFGPKGRPWVAGHEEIELALCKLYGVTKDEKYLDFAYWLLEQRGHGHGSHGDDRKWNPHHYQDVIPVRNLRTISGHAVRAMYLFCGMSDIAAFRDNTGYLEALDSLWEDVVKRQMYITGGIGVAYRSEGFSQPYDLPNYDAYCETCASIGMVLWNHRMNEWKGDGCYVDVLERSLYNGVLSGLNLKGDRFFYVNPLASHGNHHRQEWYGCACCPSNLCRFIPSIGSYIYATSRDALWVNLYIGNEAKFKVGKREVQLKMTTQYPFEGNTTLTLQTTFKGDVRLRVPGWCKSFGIGVNGQPATHTQERGYAVIQRKWKKGDVISIDFAMPVELVSADPRVREDLGKRAVQRGPLVYCAESIDNKDSFQKMWLNGDENWTVNWCEDLGGINRISCSHDNQDINLIPYYSWDNREACEMKVWLDFK